MAERKDSDREAALRLAALRHRYGDHLDDREWEEVSRQLRTAVEGSRTLAEVPLDHTHEPLPLFTPYRKDERPQPATGNAALAAVVGVFVGLVVGIANGLVVTALKVNSFIATLATSFMVFGIGFLVSDRSVLRAATDAYPAIARTRWLGITTGAWIAAGVVAAAWLLLSGTRFGRHVYASGGNAEAARLAGVPVARVKTICFALSGAAAGLAGVVSSSRSLSALPSDDFSFVFGVIAAVVVGGTSIAGGEGAVWRTIAGAFFIALMINGFNLHQVDPIWQRVIQGAVILGAVSIDAWTQRREH